MLGKSKRQPPRGFTLMEIMIAVSLFVILIIVLINIYLLALKAQRQTAARQQALSNVRNVMETLARQVRTSEIDYAYAYAGDIDPGISGSEKELALVDPDGSHIAYYVLDNQLVADTNGVKYALTSAEDITIVNLNFYIAPSTDPFKEEHCNKALPGLNDCLVPTSCTVDDLKADKSGFCGCLSDNDCASKFCDPQAHLCLPQNVQPRVTIILDFQANKVKVEDRKTVFLQTTVSSRVYKR